MKRRFSGAERAALFLAADGKCTNCGVLLQPGWHADHVHPWSANGSTDVINGQALCPTCNLAKGARMNPNYQPRDWQQDALERLDHHDGNFLVVATPGAGKTTFALAAAERFLSNGYQRVIVVVPTSHLRNQWAQAAAGFGIQLDHRFVNGDAVLASDYDGSVVTYASVAANPYLWRKISSDKPTLVILDEIHHAGEAEHLSWGPALKLAFDPARRRLLLSGTPMRTDGQPIPFIEYDRGKCVPGFNYDYGQALADGGVVRPVEFLALNGQVGWRNPGSGVHSTTSLDEADSETLANALRAALDPEGSWVPSVLRQADAELTRKRMEMPDAGGLVVASDQESARRYAKELKRITGVEPVVAVSDDPEASNEIARFTRGQQRWIVAVKMVSEGVDIPRLCVGVYATNTRSEMFVRQVVGRFVRKRGDDDETAATLFIPSIQPLLQYAADIERTVDAALAKGIELSDEESKSLRNPKLFVDIVDTSSSEAVRHSAIVGSETYEDAELRRAENVSKNLALPSTISVVQVAQILRAGGAGRVVGTSVINLPPVQPTPLADQKKSRRQVIQRKVGRLSAITGTEHWTIHRELNSQFSGKTVKESTIEELDRRLEILDDWLTWPGNG